MTKTTFAIIAILTTAFLINAQPPSETPSAPGNKNLRDDNIKRRSIALERAKREMTARYSKGMVRADIDKKYPEIKEDFEGIQTSQTAVIKGYTTGKTIDYALIESSAKQITKHAKRLDSNLFYAKPNEKKKRKKKAKESMGVRELIIKLDEAIGRFSGSAMFKNLRIVDPEVAVKARKDLTDIVKTSNELSAAASKAQ